ncbi:MAG: rhodanese-like domain-containing protein [Saprospiraceae bacterium]|jgi:rhodanese-related sulfurtransferase
MLEQKEISPREAYANYMLGNSVFVDVRENDESARQQPDLNKLMHIPLSELEDRASELPADKPVICMSWVGSRSHNAARMLNQKGFHNVKVVDGGIVAWEDEGLPVR